MHSQFPICRSSPVIPIKLQSMHEAGVSPIGMEEATLVAFSFQTLTHMASAMNWPLATEKNLKATGRYLYKNGYRSLSIPG